MLITDCPSVSMLKLGNIEFASNHRLLPPASVTVRVPGQVYPIDCVWQVEILYQLSLLQL